MEEGVVLAISGPRFNFIARLQSARDSNPAGGGPTTTLCSLINGLVAFDGCLYIPLASPLLHKILATIETISISTKGNPHIRTIT